jgi:hypothetical protein
MAIETHDPEDRTAAGQGVEREEEVFDREIRRRVVLGTGIGILALTLVCMVLMWWLTGFFVEQIRSRDLPLTDVQETRKEHIEQENELRSQIETRVYPLLEWPDDAAYPGGLVYDHEPYPPDPDVRVPAIQQVAPWKDMEAFLEEQRRIQGSVGWDDPASSPPKAHLPVDQLVDWWFSRSEKARADYGVKFPYRPPERPTPGASQPGASSGAGSGGGPDEDAGGSNDRSEESL